MLEDGTINPGEMTSFNHYALGAVADWLHRSVAGLAPAEPGYNVLEIAPLPLDGFDFANASHETPYGLASSGWKRDGASITVDVVIPANTTARVILPSSTDVIEVGSGAYSWTVDAVTDAAAFVPVGDRTPLAAIIDDPEAYAAIWTAIEKHDAEHARNFRKHTKWTPGRVLDEAIFLMPKVVRAEIDAKLADLNSSRGV
jgi:alpha-L-rhamnosidase